jgi:hypothetical protein
VENPVFVYATAGRYFSFFVAMAHKVRAFLLAKATAALLKPRRAINACNHKLSLSGLSAKNRRIFSSLIKSMYYYWIMRK